MRPGPGGRTLLGMLSLRGHCGPGPGLAVSLTHSTGSPDGAHSLLSVTRRGRATRHEQLAEGRTRCSLDVGSMPCYSCVEPTVQQGWRAGHPAGLSEGGPEHLVHGGGPGTWPAPGSGTKYSRNGRTIILRTETPSPVIRWYSPDFLCPPRNEPLTNKILITTSENQSL